MTTSPPITETQLHMLRALLTKKGWSEAYFAWKTTIALIDLTTSQAREWITRLTKDTNGKLRPVMRLEPSHPQRHRTKTLS